MPKTALVETAPVSIASLKDIVAKASINYFNIDPQKIVVEKGFNERSTFRLVELKGLIRDNGFLNEKPLVVRYDKETGQVVLRDGERRLRAVLDLIKEGLDISTIPVTITDHAPVDEVAGLVVWNNGENLSQLDQGAVYARLESEHELTRREIAAKCKVTEGHVSNCLTLNAAPNELKKKIRSNKISSSFALELCRTAGGDEEKTLKLLAKAEEKAAKKAEKNGKSSDGKVTKGGASSDKVSLTKEIRDIIETHLEDCEISDRDKRIALSLVAGKCTETEDIRNAKASL